MPWQLKRFHESHQLHFVTFSCYRRRPKLNNARAREMFERALENARQRYGFLVVGYVVMPEHVHLLLSEPESRPLSRAIQAIKQSVARQLALRHRDPFWEPRYYDFNVWSERKRIEKLRYMHRNPVTRELCAEPQQWIWSSFRHYKLGEVRIVEIESQWTARKRLVAKQATPPPKQSLGGHPQKLSCRNLSVSAKEQLHVQDKCCPSARFPAGHRANRSSR